MLNRRSFETNCISLSVSMLAVISYPPIPIVDIGPLQFSLHGVFAAVGFIAGAWLASRELAKRGFDIQKYQSVLTWGLIGALVGARYLTTPAAIIDGTPLVDTLNPISGNFSIMGGFLGGIVAGLIRMRQVGLSIWPTLDVSSFGLALGTVVGRIGDLAIVEHLGRATSIAFGYGVKPGYDLAPQHDSLECIAAEAGPNGLCGTFHHVAAYDMVGAGLLLLFLYFAYRRFRLHYGQLFSLWIVWYGLQRFVLDSLRVGMGDAEIGSLTWNQLSGLVAGLGGLALFMSLEKRQPRVEPEADQRRGAELAAPAGAPTEDL